MSDGNGYPPTDYGRGIHCRVFSLVHLGDLQEHEAKPARVVVFPPGNLVGGTVVTTCADDEPGVEVVRDILAALLWATYHLPF